MPLLPKNVRIGRNGRIGILKKIPRDLWQHPHYINKSKVIERSTGITDVEEGTKAALAMLDALEQEFTAARETDPRQGVQETAGQPVIPLPDSAIETPTAFPGDVTTTSRQRTQVGEDTRRDILAAAMHEFAEKGLLGARVDDIAARTRTTKPMIYYHFGSKEKLYAAVMEEAYVGVRSKEQSLHLDDLAPVEAMRRLVEVTFEHHAAYPEYVRLVCAENMERGRHITGRPSLVQRNAIAIETVSKLLERGEKAGAFRSGVDPFHLHFFINSFCFMRVSNRYTVYAVFGKDLWEPDDVPLQREMIIEAVLRYLQPSCS
jgi:AcrR family transcriptional regulator